MGARFSLFRFGRCLAAISLFGPLNARVVSRRECHRCRTVNQSGPVPSAFRGTVRGISCGGCFQLTKKAGYSCWCTVLVHNEPATSIDTYRADWEDEYASLTVQIASAVDFPSSSPARRNLWNAP